MRVIHRPGMKGGDLIVVEVGGNKCLCGESIGYLADEIHLDAKPFETLEVQQGIVSHRTHDQGVGTQEPQVVSYVAGGAAELSPQLGDEDRHVQEMDRWGQHVIPE